MPSHDNSVLGDPMPNEFRPITYLPGFEINREGAVRSIRFKRVSTPRGARRGSGPFVQVMLPNKTHRRAWVNALLDETFGAGAAVAAGLPPVDWDKVRRTRELGERQCARPHKAQGVTRRCNTCGRRTTNFRCDRCWEKIRGFGPAEAADIETPFDI